MASWRPQPYRAAGKLLGVPSEVLDAAVDAGLAVQRVNSSLPPIFTLRHLAHLTDADYGLLRSIVRRAEEDPYRVFLIRKRPARDGARRFRVICSPDPTLLRVQRWLARNVLAHSKSLVHPSSTAYAPKCRLVDAASPHCGSRWLIKVDIRSFFESVSEVSAYRSFRALGYQPLVAFELGRLCTRMGTLTKRRMRKQWWRHSYLSPYRISAYESRRLGHLPQGAPTSPMLANMAMVEADAQLERLAQANGLTYTRYADDLTFSTAERTFDRLHARSVISGIYQILGRHGFSPNSSKTAVVSPGGRKIVLGLLVDGPSPRLTRAFKASLRMHLHYLRAEGFGPTAHAARRGFSAVAGLRNHLVGLAAYAAQIEPEYGAKVLRELNAIAWPS
ncbi:reverse transcriptase family protein [Ideonella sp. YS5]|uniref:reverse transcriptase family protein n=1 Tax=Ideonella sp. YS5 TaxID=3453714 RepID=UPI003EEF6240